jgi:hypothetical protein
MEASPWAYTVQVRYSFGMVPITRDPAFAGLPRDEETIFKALRHPDLEASPGQGASRFGNSLVVNGFHLCGWTPMVHIRVLSLQVLRVNPIGGIHTATSYALEAT